MIIRLIAILSFITFSSASLAATITFNVEETTAGVTVSGEGYFDISNASFFYPASTPSSFFGTALSTGSGNFETYLTSINGSDFVDNTGGIFSNTSTSQTGSMFGFSSYLNRIYVPQGYSGGLLSSMASYAGATLSSLQTTTGIFGYTYNGGEIQVNVTSNLTPVPLPAGSVLLLASLFGLAFFKRKNGQIA